jgi:regulator of CtrA degradation
MSFRVVASRHPVGSVGSKDGVTVSFAERFAASEQFDHIFREGMALVETTAAYLDGAGRREAKALGPALGVVYATESMRLTTRLLEIASWLLVRRSLKAGEISLEEARVKRRRIKLTTIGRPAHVKGFSELPAELRRLIEASFALNDRIVAIDRALEAPPLALVGTTANPVRAQMQQLAAAFASGEAPRH